MASDPPAPAERPRPAAKKPAPPPGRSGAAKPGAAGLKQPPKRRKRKFDKKAVIGVVTSLLVFGLVVFFAFTIGSSSSPVPTAGPTANGPEAVAIPNGTALAAINTAVYGQVIDGIKCEVNEQVVYHIHAHLGIFVDGKAKQIPMGIGIGPPLQVQDTPSGSYVAGGSCFYWLHAHAADGIIHIESPTQTQYTLGQYFDIWGQTLAADQVGPAVGKVTAFLDGKIFPGDPRTIPLASHGVIQLDVGTVVPFQPVDLTQTKL